MSEEKRLKLIHEIETWKYLASTLAQPHQQSVKLEITMKINNMKLMLKEEKP